VGKTLQFFVMLSVTGVALENLTDHIYNNRVPYVIVIKERLSWFFVLVATQGYWAWVFQVISIIGIYVTVVSVQV
jgi:hypothetical protein